MAGRAGWREQARAFSYFSAGVRLVAAVDTHGLSAYETHHSSENDRRPRTDRRIDTPLHLAASSTEDRADREAKANDREYRIEEFAPLDIAADHVRQSTDKVP